MLIRKLHFQKIVLSLFLVSLNLPTHSFLHPQIPSILRPMHPIQHPRPAKTHIEKRMMGIMSLRLERPRPKVKPGMRRRRLKQRVSQPQTSCQDVAPPKQKRENHRKDVRKEVFYGMSVLRGECEGGGELVVLSFFRVS